MKIAIFFPGQGSQAVGMGRELYEGNEVFKKAFDECDRACDTDLKMACFEGAGLELTSVTQPALNAVNVATYKMLESKGVFGTVFAGLSLGEYSALCAAGRLTPADATKIVSVRGQLMESAVPAGEASMTAVIGLTPDEVRNVLADTEGVWLANINSLDQLIVGGRLAELDVADEKLKAAGAKMTVRLNVAGPFHTPLLAEAGKKLKSELDKYPIAQTDKTVYANVTGKQYLAGDDVRDMLARQVYTTVNWIDIMDEVVSQNDVIIECGPGNVLSKLAKKHAKLTERDVQIFSANSLESIEEIMEFVSR